MCYRVSYLLQKSILYAKRYGEDPEVIAEMEKQLDEFRIHTGTMYHSNGFDYPELPVITGDNPGSFQFLSWGLIPSWCKPDSIETIRRSTLNARCETMFTQGTYKQPARDKRCLVVIDGYFDHHHHADKKKYPYYVKLKKEQPITLAGLWDHWVDHQHKIERFTFSIVTTRANQTMKKIHNNPEMLKRDYSDESRMPVIIPEGMESVWLEPRDYEDPIEQKGLIEEVCQPYPDEELEAYSVPKLNKGREQLNTVDLVERFHYPALENQQGSLF